MLRPKPTMISLSMKDVTEHLESIDRKASLARASGTVNSSSMRQPLGALRNESTPAMADEPRVIYLNERDARIHGITPVPISTDMLHSFDLTIRSRSSAESGSPGAPATTARSFQSLPPDDAENRTQTTSSLEDDSVSLGFLESEPDDSEEPNFIQEDQDSMMTEVPDASPIPRVPRPSMDYRDSGFEGSSRDSSSFGSFTPELSPNVTIRQRGNRTPNSRTRLTMQVPDDASTPPAPIPSAVERLRARHQPLARSPLFRSIDPSQTPMRPTTVGLAPRLNSPGTPSMLFSQPARSTRTYRQREMTYSYDESENPNGEEEVQIWEDGTAEQPIDDDDYYDDDDEYYGEDYEEYEGEDEDIGETEPPSDVADERLEAAAAAHAEQAAAIHLDLMMERAGLRYREHDSLHDSSTTETDDMDEVLPSSPPMHMNSAGGGPGGVDGNMSRSSRTLVQNLQSAATSSATSRATSVRTVSGLPSSPSLMLPPPFSASPRKVSDNNALPASPASPAIPDASMMQSSDDDRGRGRTRFPRLGAGGRPSSMDAQVGDSPASPVSPFDYSNLSQEDGRPRSNASSNRTNVTALPIRPAMGQHSGSTTSTSNSRPSSTQHMAVARPSDIPTSYFTAGRSSQLQHTDGPGASAASLYCSHSPLPRYTSGSRRPSPERTQSAVLPRPLPPLPIHSQQTTSMPPPPAPGATPTSPSRDGLWRSNTSPVRQVRQPTGPSGTIPSGQWMASSRPTSSDQVDGPPPSPYYTRPSTSRDATTPGHPYPGRTAFPNLGSFTTPARPLSPIPQPHIPPVPPGSLTPSAPASAWRTLTTTSGTRSEGRLPALPNANRSRAPPTLPMRLPRTPGRRAPGGATLSGARTPGGRKVRIYNDAVSTSAQPQTPEDLPESRHRSRYHQNYTMPIEQRNTPRDRAGLRYSEMRIRRGRGAGTRSDSPLGARGGGAESPLGLRGGGRESPLGLRGGGGREGLGEGVENGNDRGLYQRGQEAVERRLLFNETVVSGEGEGEGAVGVGYWRAAPVGRSSRVRRVTGRFGDEYWEQAEDGSYSRLEGGLGRGRSGSHS